MCDPLSGLDESAIKKQHLGCYKDNPKSRDLPYLGLTSATDNTIRNCVRFCREQGFRFAGLQVGPSSPGVTTGCGAGWGVRGSVASPGVTTGGGAGWV